MAFSIEHLNAVRDAEVERAARWLPPGGQVLEIGAGTGCQARALAERGFAVTAIDIPDSTYAGLRVFPIIDYDGRHIPFPDGSFDAVFSSNVLEHVPDLAQLHREVGRGLRPDGRALHILPTHWWRLWTTVSAFPLSLQRIAGLPAQTPLPAGRGALPLLFYLSYLCKQAIRITGSALRQSRHGERGNVVSETWLFRPEWWRRNFRGNGFEILREAPMGLFYTGNMIFGTRWSIERRQRLARKLGSSCRIFELRPASPGQAIAKPLGYDTPPGKTAAGSAGNTGRSCG